MAETLQLPRMSPYTRGAVLLHGLSMSISSLLFLVSSELISNILGHVIGVISYATGVLVQTVIYLQFTNRVAHKSVDADRANRLRIIYYLTTSAIYLPFYLMLSSELFRQLNLAFGGFTSSYGDYWHWALLGVSWLIDDLSFGATEIYAWSLSDVHAVADWAKLLTLAFNVVLVLFAITSIVRTYQWLRDRPRLSSKTALLP